LAGKRKITPSGVGDADTRVAVLLPKGVDRQLRALAARRNSAVAPIIREWIIEKLREEPGITERRVAIAAIILHGKRVRGCPLYRDAIRAGIAPWRVDRFI